MLNVCLMHAVLLLLAAAATATVLLLSSTPARHHSYAQHVVSAQSHWRLHVNAARTRICFMHVRFCVCLTFFRVLVSARSPHGCGLQTLNLPIYQPGNYVYSFGVRNASAVPLLWVDSTQCVVLWCSDRRMRVLVKPECGWER